MSKYQRRRANAPNGSSIGVRKASWQDTMIYATLFVAAAALAVMIQLQL